MENISELEIIEINDTRTEDNKITFKVRAAFYSPEYSMGYDFYYYLTFLYDADDNYTLFDIEVSNTDPPIIINQYNPEQEENSRLRLIVNGCFHLIFSYSNVHFTNTTPPTPAEGAMNLRSYSS